MASVENRRLDSRTHTKVPGNPTLLAVAVLGVALSTSVPAATIENTDDKSYTVQLRESGRLRHYVVAARVSVTNVCDDSCELALPSTRQSIPITRFDRIYITGGVMTREAPEERSPEVMRE